MVFPRGHWGQSKYTHRGRLWSGTHYALGNAFLTMRKTRTIVTCSYIDCSSAHLVPAHVHFVDLLSSYLFAEACKAPAMNFLRFWGSSPY
jgi:hypothetical protein